jgi:hypothetical protein
MVKVTNAKNAINHLWDDQGSKVVEVEHIKKVATDYYKNLLGHSNHVFDDSKAARVRSLLRKKITKDQKMEMQKEVSEDEIRRTILAIVQKPQGLMATLLVSSRQLGLLCEKMWWKLSNPFFFTARLLREVNATILSLVPKKINPSSMGEFRPMHVVM